MLMPGRNGGSSYRYGMNGMEQDDEVKGDGSGKRNGNSVNYRFRMHDPRLGRFFAVDPLTPNYPHYTPYSFSGNKVIAYVELEGLEEKSIIGQEQTASGGGTMISTTEYDNYTNSDGKPENKGGIRYAYYDINGNEKYDYIQPQVTIYGEKSKEPTLQAPIENIYSKISTSIGNSMRNSDNFVASFEYTHVGQAFKSADISIQSLANTINSSGFIIKPEYNRGMITFGVKIGFWGTGTETGFMFDPYVKMAMDLDYNNSKGWSSKLGKLNPSGFSIKGGFFLSTKTYKEDYGLSMSVANKSTISLLKAQSSIAIDLTTKDKTYELMVGKGNSFRINSGVFVTNSFKFRPSFKH